MTTDFYKSLDTVMAITKSIENIQKDIIRLQNAGNYLEDGSIKYISNRNMLDIKEKLIMKARQDILYYDRALINIPGKYNDLRVKCESYMEVFFLLRSKHL